MFAICLEAVACGTRGGTFIVFAAAMIGLFFLGRSIKRCIHNMHVSGNYTLWGAILEGAIGMVIIGLILTIAGFALLCFKLIDFDTFELGAKWGWAVGCISFVYTFADYFSKGKSSLHNTMQKYGSDHPFTRSALEEAVERKMKADGYPDPFVKAFHTVGGKWEGDVSWGHNETDNFHCRKITIQTDGYYVSYELGESRY